jgi:DNA (cytosine-5)-methyltransferase 1
MKIDKDSKFNQTNTKEAASSHKSFTFIDLFAGIGGFHIALHNVGGECVFASEWDVEARNTYTKNFNKVAPGLFDSQGNPTDLFAGDITQVNPKVIPKHDILCAGFPCQPFSISGKQQGFNDTRGTLFFNILEIINEKKPKVILLENVKHLIHHDKGNTFRVIKEELTKNGYKINWKVLNAKDFGLAQNRERIIIIGSIDKEFDFNKLKKQKNTYIKDILDDSGDFEYLNEKDYTILEESKWKKQVSGLIFCGYRNKSVRTVGARLNTEHLSRVHKQPNRIYHIDGTHPTIPSQEPSGRFWIYDGSSVRKLTILECYKLQGFPYDFVVNDKRTASYNQVGNSVAVPMIEALAKEIKEQLL